MARIIAVDEKESEPTERIGEVVSALGVSDLSSLPSTERNDTAPAPRPYALHTQSISSSSSASSVFSTAVTAVTVPSDGSLGSARSPLPHTSTPILHQGMPYSPHSHFSQSQLAYTPSAFPTPSQYSQTSPFLQHSPLYSSTSTAGNFSECSLPLSSGVNLHPYSTGGGDDGHKHHTQSPRLQLTPAPTSAEYDGRYSDFPQCTAPPASSPIPYFGYQPYGCVSFPSTPVTPSMREDRYSVQGCGLPAYGSSRRNASYHPYHSPSTRSIRSSKTPSEPSASSPPIKSSSIFSTAVRKMPDVRCEAVESAGPNYGRLPDGKIIELYPAMMRTIQACEYCRSRKAKCSGGLPCERCAKKNVKCEYAQLDKKRKVKITTGELDMSGGMCSKSESYAAGNACGPRSSSGSTGGGNGPCSSIKSCSVNGPITRKMKKVPDELQLINTSDEDTVPLDLSFSPFPSTFVSSLSMPRSEYLGEVPVRRATGLLAPGTTWHQSFQDPIDISSLSVFLRNDHKSPSSLDSNSMDDFTPTLRPEARLSPTQIDALPVSFSQNNDGRWVNEHPPITSVTPLTQEGLFYRQEHV